MRHDVTEIQVGTDVLVLGDVASMPEMTPDRRRRSGVCGVLRRMLPDAHAVRQLRRYWANRSISQPVSPRTDQVLLEMVEAAIESGLVQAMVLPGRDLPAWKPTGKAGGRASDL